MAKLRNKIKGIPPAFKNMFPGVIGIGNIYLVKTSDFPGSHSLDAGH
jgi:hypothetical protein